MDKKQLQDILSQPYQPQDWVKVLKEIFGVRNILQKPSPILLPSNKKAEAAFELGSFNTSDDRIIGLYLVKVKPEVWLERNKVGLRELLRSVYKYEVDGALIVFEQQDKWRLSFVSEIRSITEDGSTTKKITEPKRYTYLLGKGEKTKTPVTRLSLIGGKTISLEDIRNAFSVEALNEEFYKIVARQFYKMVGATEGSGAKAITYDSVLKLPASNPNCNGTAKIYQEFAVRLIGRTIFCWFLKVKKSDAGISLLPEHLLSSEAVKKNNSYYHSILEKLFFQTLNTPMDERVKYLPDGCELIPFLNGGLFEPQTDDYYKANQTTGLSENINTLKIPDEWFQEFFEKLEQYNFTIDENSVVDIEVSVDPEMLGRIFENLLAEIDPDSGETARKATGSFYTPREIVDYMTTESLVHYLHNQTKIEKESLHPIFKIDSEVSFSENDSEIILEALDKLKTLDPACGSGAFPIGILQKMVIALQKLDKDATWWKARQINRIENAILRKQVKEKLQQTTVEYARKIGVIQNSLYGVDIQPIAAEISKLRCFLSLIVDENIDETKPNRGVEPLPNLEFKFVTADTLLQLPKEQGVVQFSKSNQKNTVELEQELHEIRLEYLQSTGEEKLLLKQQFKNGQKQIFDQQGIFGTIENSRAHLISTWNPFNHDKANWFDPLWMYGVNEFDVVIGNPPYVQLQKDEGRLAKIYANEKYETYERTGDVYSLFYERGFKLLSTKGLLAYITSNKWMKSKYGSKTRNFFVKSTNPLVILDFGDIQVFKSATVDTNVLLLEKEINKNKLIGTRFTSEYRNSLPIDLFVLQKKQNLIFNNDEEWIIREIKSSGILTRIIEKGIPIKKMNLQINRGILTGFNDAYIIDDETKINLLSEDETSIEIIKPLVRGRDVRKWKIDNPKLWLINAHNGIRSKNIEPVDVKGKYKAIWKWLLQFQNDLEKRSDKGNHWSNLRNCAYLEDFEKLKIIYPETMRHAKGNKEDFPRFILDDSNFYCDKTTFIITGENLRYLTAFFNSKIMKMLIPEYVTSWDTSGFMMQKIFFEKIPVLQTNRTKVFEMLVEYIQLLSHDSFVEQVNEYVPNSHIVQLFEEVIDALFFELYFEEDFINAKISFMKYAERDFKSIEGLGKDEKIKTIHQAYQTLREKNNEIRQNLKLMDTRLADLIMPIKTAK
jgi:adenine-specific DNA-methyltransferase